MPDQKNKGTILWDVPDDEIINYTIKEEGLNSKRVDHLYLDHLGNVTIGYGRMIPNKKAILNVPLYIKGKEELASRGESENAYEQIKRKPFGKSRGAATFKPTANEKYLELREEGARELLRYDLETAARDARSNFQNLDDYSPSRQKAILDMQFNMGLSNFNRNKWPKFFDAVENERWNEAASQSHRKDIHESRNKSIYQWLMESQ